MANNSTNKDPIIELPKDKPFNIVTDCVLMGCDVRGYPTLEELSKDNPDEAIRNQAKTLIDGYGFSKDCRLCEECFWK